MKGNNKYHIISRKSTYQCPGQFIGFKAKVSFSTSNENMFSCKIKIIIQCSIKSNAFHNEGNKHLLKFNSREN